jgi:hypothetical protein
VLLTLLETFLGIFFWNHPQAARCAGNYVSNCVKVLLSSFLWIWEHPDVKGWQNTLAAITCSTCQKLMDGRQHVLQCAVMMEHPSIPLFLYTVRWLLSNMQDFFVKQWINCLTSRNKLRMNNSFHAEEHNQYDLHMNLNWSTICGISSMSSLRVLCPCLHASRLKNFTILQIQQMWPTHAYIDQAYIVI